nr:uncharacterized protein LOC109186567 [Ipomoea trifida]
MKKKRSGIKTDASVNSAATKPIDGYREPKQGMQPRLLADARSRLSENHSFSSGVRHIFFRRQLKNPPHLSPAQKSHADFKLIFVLGLAPISSSEQPLRPRSNLQPIEEISRRFQVDFCVGPPNLRLLPSSRTSRSRRNGSGLWKMTSFQKLDFTISNVLECLRDGNVIGGEASR